MPIRTLPSRAIADASIQAVDIANSSISKVKIDADTRLGCLLYTSPSPRD